MNNSKDTEKTLKGTKEKRMTCGLKADLLSASTRSEDGIFKTLTENSCQAVRLV